MHTALRSARSFARRHDDVPAFHAASIALTVLAAALLNIGAFAVLIAAHAALDIVKYRDVHGMGWRKTILATFREGMIDVVFLSLAFCFALYLHHGQSVFALSALVRFEEIILRVFGIGLARLEVLVHGIWVFSDVRHHLLDVHASKGRWNGRDTLCLLGLIATFSFIICAVAWMEPGAFAQVFVEQMIPWRI